MGVLRTGRPLAAGLAALAGCYSPTVRDCVVHCAPPGECASGQICGDDGLCAAPEMAGHCRSDLTDLTDGGPDDAPVIDAKKNGPAPVSLRVQATRNGGAL